MCKYFIRNLFNIFKYIKLVINNVKFFIFYNDLSSTVIVFVFIMKALNIKKIVKSNRIIFMKIH